MNGLIVWLDGLFGKLPVFPDGARDFLRRVLPWVITIASAFSLLALAAALGILSTAFVFVPWTWYGTSPLAMLDLYVVTPLAALLGLLGGIGMIRGRAKGWELAVYSGVLLVIGGVITMSLGSIIVNAIGLWLLFQIRSYFSADHNVG
ncbi:MAG: hypothetical protein N3B17_05215 [Chlorobi bacterium]|nr:hypothetical protein [Chlorobiota bacterium]